MNLETVFGSHENFGDSDEPPNLTPWVPLGTLSHPRKFHCLSDIGGH